MFFDIPTDEMMRQAREAATRQHGPAAENVTMFVVDPEGNIIIDDPKGSKVISVSDGHPPLEELEKFMIGRNDVWMSLIDHPDYTPTTTQPANT